MEEIEFIVNGEVFKAYRDKAGNFTILNLAGYVMGAAVHIDLLREIIGKEIAGKLIGDSVVEFDKRTREKLGIGHKIIGSKDAPF